MAEIQKHNEKDQPRSEAGSIKATYVEEDVGANSELHRSLTSRHLTMIGIGSSIGMGLWLGSGKVLATGGPVALFLGFCVASSIVWAVTQSIGEMAVMYPLPSSFVRWTNKFVHPAAGFALGWCYWFNYWITVSNELQGVVTFLVILTNVWGVRVFGEVEVVMSRIKFGWIFVVVIASIVISAGGAPNDEAVGFRYWNETPFINGFVGFLNVLPVCVFALSGSETTGMVAAETSSPRKYVPRAVNAIWYRLVMFYLLGSLMVTITVSPTNPALFGSAHSAATQASPFVIAFSGAKLKPLAHMMNAIILLSVFLSASINIFGGARTLYGLGQIGMAPKVMTKADSWGRPRLVALLTMFGWGMICFSHIRMRYAWKVQGRSPADLPWRSVAWPWSAYWGLGWCIFMICVQFYLALWPIGGGPTAIGPFSSYSSVVAIIVIFLGAKIYYRGPRLLDASKIDLDSDRRWYSTEEEQVQEEKSTIRKLWARI
ncbi:amino acid transporter [Fusarium subglutinans]|uniref:Amino acid transporter n=1 Tax=Gibberella subglutinans TaxID=42677 RepID=A0A8H5P9X2_GIBSU|nr:amino acid transporter [Fusarium subglutinans]KAF5592658.1 amino acid transporter [Fusarium subglutinans]